MNKMSIFLLKYYTYIICDDHFVRKNILIIDSTVNSLKGKNKSSTNYKSIR